MTRTPDLETLARTHPRIAASMGLAEAVLALADWHGNGAPGHCKCGLTLPCAMAAYAETSRDRWLGELRKIDAKERVAMKGALPDVADPLVTA